MEANDEIKNNLRSFLISTPTKVTVSKLIQMYNDFEGSLQPKLKQLGYETVEQYFSSIPDVLRVVRSPNFFSSVVVPVRSEKSEHIDSLVSGQRSQNGASKFRRGVAMRPKPAQSIYNSDFVTPHRFQSEGSSSSVTQPRYRSEGSASTPLHNRSSENKNYSSSSSTGGQPVVAKRVNSSENAELACSANSFGDVQESKMYTHSKYRNNMNLVNFYDVRQSQKYRYLAPKPVQNNFNMNSDIDKEIHDTALKRMKDFIYSIPDSGLSRDHFENAIGKIIGSPIQDDVWHACSQVRNLFEPRKDGIFKKQPDKTPSIIEEELVNCRVNSYVDNHNFEKQGCSKNSNNTTELYKTVQVKDDFNDSEWGDNFEYLKESNDRHSREKENNDPNVTMKSKVGISSKKSYKSLKKLPEEEMLKNIQLLLAKFPNGIWCSEILNAYKDLYGASLRVEDYGYPCIMTMAVRLPNIFSTYRPDPTGDMILYDPSIPLSNIKGTEPFVPKTVVKNVFNLLKNYQSGLPRRELLSKYQEMYEEEIDLQEYNCSCINDLVSCLSEVLKEYNINGELRLFAKQKSWVAEEEEINIVSKSHVLGLDIEPIYNVPDDVCRRDFVLKREELPEKLNEGIQIIIGEVYSPYRFYVYLYKNHEKLTTMMQLLNSFYDGSQMDYVMIDDFIRVNTLCVVLHLPDSKWYRGRIKKVIRSPTDPQVEVFLFDYGTPITVKKTELRYLIKRFAELPCQALRGRLLWVKPVPCDDEISKWTSDVAEEFLDLVGCNEGPIMAKVINFNRTTGYIEVVLTKHTKSGEIYFHTELIKRRLADLATEEESTDIKRLMPYNLTISKTSTKDDKVLLPKKILDRKIPSPETKNHGDVSRMFSRDDFNRSESIQRQTIYTPIVQNEDSQISNNGLNLTTSRNLQISDNLPNGIIAPPPGYEHLRVSDNGPNLSATPHVQMTDHEPNGVTASPGYEHLRISDNGPNCATSHVQMTNHGPNGVTAPSGYEHLRISDNGPNLSAIPQVQMTNRGPNGVTPPPGFGPIPKYCNSYNEQSCLPPSQFSPVPPGFGHIPPPPPNNGRNTWQPNLINPNVHAGRCVYPGTNGSGYYPPSSSYTNFSPSPSYSNISPSPLYLPSPLYPNLPSYGNQRPLFYPNPVRNPHAAIYPHPGFNPFQGLPIYSSPPVVGPSPGFMNYAGPMPVNPACIPGQFITPTTQSINQPRRNENKNSYIPPPGFITNLENEVKPCNTNNVVNPESNLRSALSKESENDKQDFIQSEVESKRENSKSQSLRETSEESKTEEKINDSSKNLLKIFEVLENIPNAKISIILEGKGKKITCKDWTEKKENLTDSCYKGNDNFDIKIKYNNSENEINKNYSANEAEKYSNNNLNRLNNLDKKLIPSDFGVNNIKMTNLPKNESNIGIESSRNGNKNISVSNDMEISNHSNSPLFDDEMVKKIKCLSRMIKHFEM